MEFFAVELFSNNCHYILKGSDSCDYQMKTAIIAAYTYIGTVYTYIGTTTKIVVDLGGGSVSNKSLAHHPAF